MINLDYKKVLNQNNHTFNKWDNKISSKCTKINKMDFKINFNNNSNLKNKYFPKVMDLLTKMKKSLMILILIIINSKN